MNIDMMNDEEIEKYMKDRRVSEEEIIVQRPMDKQFGIFVLKKNHPRNNNKKNVIIEIQNFNDIKNCFQIRTSIDALKKAIKIFEEIKSVEDNESEKQLVFENDGYKIIVDPDGTLRLNHDICQQEYHFHKSLPLLYDAVAASQKRYKK